MKELSFKVMPPPDLPDLPAGKLLRWSFAAPADGMRACERLIAVTAPEAVRLDLMALVFVWGGGILIDGGKWHLVVMASHVERVCGDLAMLGYRAECSE